MQLGFELVGIAPAGRPTHADYYLNWLESGYHGEMAYLARPDAVARRLNPSEALPGARSIIVVAMNYHVQNPESLDDPSRGLVARYARGSDYHRVFEEKLEQLATELRVSLGSDVGIRAYVDYGPVLERDHAQRAGLGWIGKNTLLIHPNLGSYLFLGELLTDAELEPDDPFRLEHCGTCERCIDACPTGAIKAGRKLDARLCISYLTIELRGPIPIELRALIDNRIFGCDICQEVCPWNREIAGTSEPRFQPRADVSGVELIALMGLSEEQFRQRFSDTPLTRPKRTGLLRNVAVALGNWGDRAAVPVLTRARGSTGTPHARASRLGQRRAWLRPGKAQPLRLRGPVSR
jgi:epoxyqueuosine reductase